MPTDTMTENDYLLAWGLYAFAALGCLLVWFRITRWMWRYLREPLRVVLAVLLLTPTIVDPVKDLYAPAVAISALDLVFKVGGNAWRAISDLAMYGMFAFIAYLVFVAIRWPFLSRANARREAQARAAEDAARENAVDEPYTAPVAERLPRNPPPASGLRVEPRL